MSESKIISINPIQPSSENKIDDASSQNNSQEQSILDFLDKTGYPEWDNLFEDAYSDLQRISDILCDEEEFYPKLENVFSAFYLTPLKNIRVVILGQDPYHSTGIKGTPIANGLAFSVNPGERVPPSLRNIYKEIKSEYGDEFNIPYSGDLTKWATQGIFLLNTALTVKPGKAGSHLALWDSFVTRVIKTIISANNGKVIFVLWGRKAQQYKKIIRGKSIVLESGHPSPLSVNLFFGNNHFKLINEHLTKLGFDPIKW